MSYEIDGRPGDEEEEHDFDNAPANPEPAEDEKVEPAFDTEDEHDFDDLPGDGGEQGGFDSDQDAPSYE